MICRKVPVALPSAGAWPGELRGGWWENAETQPTSNSSTPRIAFDIASLRRGLPYRFNLRSVTQRVIRFKILNRYLRQSHLPNTRRFMLDSIANHEVQGRRSFSLTPKRRCAYEGSRFCSGC